MKVASLSQTVRDSGWPYHIMIERPGGEQISYYPSERINELLAANTALVERARAAEAQVRQLERVIKD